MRDIYIYIYFILFLNSFPHIFFVHILNLSKITTSSHYFKNKITQRNSQVQPPSFIPDSLATSICQAGKALGLLYNFDRNNPLLEPLSQIRLELALEMNDLKRLVNNS